MLSEASHFQLKKTILERRDDFRNFWFSGWKKWTLSFFRFENKFSNKVMFSEDSDFKIHVCVMWLMDTSFVCDVDKRLTSHTKLGGIYDSHTRASSYEFCVWCVWHVGRLWMSHIARTSHICHVPCEWVMSRVNESSHVWMSHVTCEWAISLRPICIIYSYVYVYACIHVYTYTCILYVSYMYSNVYLYYICILNSYGGHWKIGFPLETRLPILR